MRLSEISHIVYAVYLAEDVGDYPLSGITIISRIVTLKHFAFISGFINPSVVCEIPISPVVTSCHRADLIIIAEGFAFCNALTIDVHRDMEQREEHGVEEYHQLVVAVLIEFHLDREQRRVRVGGSSRIDISHVTGVGLIAIAVEEVDLDFVDETAQDGHNVTILVRVAGRPRSILINPLVGRSDIRFGGVSPVSITIAQSDSPVGDAVAIRHYNTSIRFEAFTIILRLVSRSMGGSFGSGGSNRLRLTPCARISIISIGKAREEVIRSIVRNITQVDLIKELKQVFNHARY